MSVKSVVAHQVRRLVGYYGLQDQIKRLQEAVAQGVSASPKDKVAEELNLLKTVDRKDLGKKRYILLLEFRPKQTIKVIPPSSYLEKTNGTLVAEECELQIDDAGFIVSSRPDKADRRVILLGSSPVENLYIPQPKRIATLLEDAFAGAGKPIKVYNAGISYAHILHSINSLLNKCIPLRPRCIVYYSAPVLDIMANEVEGSFWNPLSEIGPVRTAGQDTVTGVVSEFKNRNGFADERALLNIMIDICARFGIKLIVATWPVTGEYTPFMKVFQPNAKAFEQEYQQNKALNVIVRDICAERGVHVLDLERDFAPLDHQTHFYDINHPNIKGCEKIAELTHNLLKDQLK